MRTIGLLGGMSWEQKDPVPLTPRRLGASLAGSRAGAPVIYEELVLGVVLGCTEIELLIRPGDVDVPTFPTTALHVAAAVRAALVEEGPLPPTTIDG